MLNSKATCPKCGKNNFLVFQRQAKLDFPSNLPTQIGINEIPAVLNEGKKLIEASRKGELREIPVERFNGMCRECGYKGWTNWDSSKT
jgi:predicted nucleic-acid-binding Zn-ribbon protein